jgi:hypothetical protein
MTVDQNMTLDQKRGGRQIVAGPRPAVNFVAITLRV